MLALVITKFVTVTPNICTRTWRGLSGTDKIGFVVFGPLSLLCVPPHREVLDKYWPGDASFDTRRHRRCIESAKRIGEPKMDWERESHWRIGKPRFPVVDGTSVALMGH